VGFQFQEERVQEGYVFVFGTLFHVKAAVGTQLGAERDVNVEVLNGWHEGREKKRSVEELSLG
jgi:hypothetical protein